MYLTSLSTVAQVMLPGYGVHQSKQKLEGDHTFKSVVLLEFYLGRFSFSWGYLRLTFDSIDVFKNGLHQ